MFLSVSVIASGADFVCPKVTPDDGEKLEYRLVADPVRCEGYYTREVSQEFIELVSLTVGPIVFSSNDKTALSLRVPWLSTAGSKAQLLIQPLGARPLYRVDLPIDGGRVDWNPKPMLNATGLDLSRLGFLAELPMARSSISMVTPVAMTNDAHDPAVTATVRVSVKVRSMRYRVVAPAGSGIDKAWQPIPQMPLYAWDSAKLRLNLPATSGSYRVDVEAINDFNRRLPLLRFSVPGSHGK